MLKGWELWWGVDMKGEQLCSWDGQEMPVSAGDTSLGASLHPLLPSRTLGTLESTGGAQGN